MKSNDKSLPLPVLLKSMTEELHITDLPEGCSNTEVQAVRKGPPAKSGPSENIRRAGFVYQEDFFSLIPPEQSPALLLFHR